MKRFTRFAWLATALVIGVVLVAAAAVPPAALTAPPDTLLDSLSLELIVAPFVVGALRTIAADNGGAPVRDTVRQELNHAIADLYYFFLNRPAWQVAAAAVAPPVVAIGTTASKVKTTATTQLYLNGVPKSLTATDDLWTLTGSTLAAGSVRRYLLCWDGTSATTVVSVIASDDQVIASYASAAAALAACRFPSLPPAGTGIVGILSVTNVTNPFIPATTLLSAAGVTDEYIDGIDDSVFLSKQVIPT